MKKMILALVLLFAFAPAALADMGPAATQSFEAEWMLDADGLPMSALQVAMEEASLAGFGCPWYTISCNLDKQCDSYCGARGAGACESGCCACLF